MVDILKKTLTKDQLLFDPKVRPAMELGDAVQSLRRQRAVGAKVGFTNGRFKVLTPSHCLFLAACKSKCDILIVGINSDYSMRLLKSPSIFDQKERAFALCALAVVDYVTIFDEETPFLTISEINPDVVFKGSDYKESDVVSAGCRVDIIDIPIKTHFSDVIDFEIKQREGGTKKFFNV